MHGECQKLLGRRHFYSVLKKGVCLSDVETPVHQNVRAADVEDQQHLDDPVADAEHLHQTLDNLLVTKVCSQLGILSCHPEFWLRGR